MLTLSKDLNRFKLKFADKLVFEIVKNNIVSNSYPAFLRVFQCFAFMSQSEWGKRLFVEDVIKFMVKQHSKGVSFKRQRFCCDH